MILKSKICGGSLDITEGQTVCECEYCGTRQTLPKLDNERKDYCWWWLRTSGKDGSCAASVYCDGSILSSGDNVDNSARSIRPAMWIDLS